MPSNIAHHVFGQDILERLPRAVRDEVTASKKEFDIGLQGPDIFFYSIMNSAISKYGSDRHNQPAEKMFLPMLSRPRRGASLAYIVGLICHYALDRRCHPYVIGRSRNIAEHLEMESYYDRHIIERLMLKSGRQRYIPASGFDVRAMAEVWPLMTPATIINCVRSQRFIIWLLDRRWSRVLADALPKKRGRLSSLSLPSSMSEKQTEHSKCLDLLYGRALDECEMLIADALVSMGSERPVLGDFSMNYKGITPDL